MKLYTEEQVRKAIELSRDTHLEGRAYMQTEQYDYSDDEVVDLLTPIELPSDEEIENKGKCVFNDAQRNIYNHYNTVISWVEGAKWMRDKIINNKS